MPLDDPGDLCSACPHGWLDHNASGCETCRCKLTPPVPFVEEVAADPELAPLATEEETPAPDDASPVPADEAVAPSEGDQFSV